MLRSILIIFIIEVALIYGIVTHVPEPSHSLVGMNEKFWAVHPSYFRVSSCSAFQKPSHTAAEWGKAELHILDFKTTWSEFQKPSQTAAERGEAELRILDFKTTWSEFQKPSQTAAMQGKAELGTSHPSLSTARKKKMCKTKAHHHVFIQCLDTLNPENEKILTSPFWENPILSVLPYKARFTTWGKIT